MEHYFSRTLIYEHWLGRDGGDPSELGMLVGKCKGRLAITKLEQDVAKKFKLTSRLYFSVPQLLALDFYMTFRWNDPVLGVPQRRKVLLNACKRLLTLPNAGWKVDAFKAILIHPYRCHDWFIALGTSFDFAHLQGFREELNKRIVYKGSRFVLKVKKILDDQWTFGQATPIGTFWSIRSYIQRRGWAKCKTVACELEKKRLINTL